MKRLVPFAVAAAALGSALIGCGPLPLPPPPQTTGGTVGASGGSSGTTGQGAGSSGSTGQSGSSGTTGSSSCFGLPETACLARPDCEPVYGVDAQGSTVFEQCQVRICEELLCADNCQLVPTADGCPICQCPTTCASNADCPQGDYCDFASAADAGVVVYDPPTPVTGPFGTCEPVVVCPLIACAPADPTQICTTTTDSNGCPVCSCSPPGCQTDAQCGVGSVCRVEPCNSLFCVNRCVPETCQTNADCKSGETCEANNCPAGIISCDQVPPGVELPCCATSSQCVAAPPPPPSGCNVDSDCPSGDVCVGCCPPNADCAELCAQNSGTCEPAPPPSCNTDADCSLGQTCQPDPTSPCSPGSPNPNGCNALRDPTVCLPAPTCSSNADCQSGEICAESPLNPCKGPGATCDVLLPNICQPAPIP